MDRFWARAVIEAVVDGHSSGLMESQPLIGDFPDSGFNVVVARTLVGGETTRCFDGATVVVVAVLRDAGDEVNAGEAIRVMCSIGAIDA